MTVRHHLSGGSIMVSRIAALSLLVTVSACGIFPGDQEGTARVPASPPAKSVSTSVVAAADATLADGRFGEAMQIYQEILVADPKSVAAQYGVAECLLGLGKAADARPMFGALRENEQYRAVALQGEGISLLVLGQREGAAESLRAAVSANPRLWRAYNGLGLLADLKRQPKEAAEFYARALASKPDSSALLNNLGYSRLLAGKPDEAITNFQKALGLDPRSETITNNLRLAVAAKGRYSEALRSVPKEQMATVLNNIGYVAMQRGDLKAAEGYFARSMDSSASFNAVAAKNLEQLKSMQEHGQ